MAKFNIMECVKNAEDHVMAFGTKACMAAKKRSPEILLGLGLITGGAAFVMACVASTKVNDIFADTHETVENIHAMKLEADAEEGVVVEDKAVKKALAVAYVHCGMEVVKLYGPALGMGAISVTSILASNNILRKRNVALSAAYAAADKGFKEYRNRVIQRFGETVDQELRYGLQPKTVEEVSTDENGAVTRVEKVTDTVDGIQETDCLRVFKRGCSGWTNDMDLNLMQLRGSQNYANDKLRTRGYMYLNEICDMIGIHTTKGGQILGWVRHDVSDGDGYIDFRMRVVDIPIDGNPDNGYEPAILLDFNVDGNILDLMDEANLDK